jgi:transposase InsO family protein
LGIDSDNGGEFINHQLKDWCELNRIQFTRGRPYRKNDNCFVEQKNGDIVRKTVYYHRFEGQKMHDALESSLPVSEPPAQLLVPDAAPGDQGEAGLGEVQENLREGTQDALPAAARVS